MTQTKLAPMEALRTALARINPTADINEQAFALEAALLAVGYDVIRTDAMNRPWLGDLMRFEEEREADGQPVTRHIEGHVIAIRETGTLTTDIGTFPGVSVTLRLADGTEYPSVAFADESRS